MQKECIGCRKIKDVNKNDICDSCLEWEKNHLEKLRKEVGLEFTCTQCGYEGVATDLHHIHGRKNSDVTIRVCCNCHREIHKGVRELIHA